MADLELRAIAKYFGETLVLEDISLHVADGGFTILLGPSGCGKSTLLRIIAGLERQSAGEVFIGGQPVGQCSPQERDIAMVFQTYALYPHLSVRENLAFGLKMRGASRGTIDARIQEAADLLGIADLLDRRPRELSGGQRQRVAMGRAIVRKPRLFLFDEPLSNLDARLRTNMRVELKKLHRRLGATMIYVTHDQVEAMTLADTIVLLNHGRVRQIDPPSRIYAAPADPFVAGFIGNPGMNLMQGAVAHKGHHWIFNAGGVSLAVPPIRSPIPIEGVSRTVLGIRPEDIRLEPSGQPESTLVGRIEVAEDLGADSLLHVRAGEHRLVARVSSSHDLRPETDITLYLPHEHLHLFVDDRRADWQ